MESTTKSLLDKAENVMLNGDYGTAFFFAEAAHDAALQERDPASESASALMYMAFDLMLTHFATLAEERGLKLTPDNAVRLMREHSPHVAKYWDLLGGKTTGYHDAPVYADEVARLRTRKPKTQRADIEKSPLEAIVDLIDDSYALNKIFKEIVFKGGL